MPDAIKAPEPKLESLGDPTEKIQDHSDTISALDSAFAKMAQDKGVEEVPGLKIESKPEPTAEEKAAAEKKTADEKAAKEAVPTPDEKAVAEKKAADEKIAAEASKKASELYADVKLPPTARGASAEAFATLKSRAATDLAARDKQISENAAKLAETTAELEKLREQ